MAVLKVGCTLGKRIHRSCGIILYEGALSSAEKA